MASLSKNTDEKEKKKYKGNSNAFCVPRKRKKWNGKYNFSLLFKSTKSKARNEIYQ